jgi:hypothetical protein
MPMLDKQIYIFSSHGTINPNKGLLKKIENNNVFVTFTYYGTPLINSTSYLIFHKCLKNKNLKDLIFSTLSKPTYKAMTYFIERKVLEYGLFEYISDMRIKMVTYIEDDLSRKRERVYMKTPLEMYDKLTFLSFDDILLKYKFRIDYTYQSTILYEFFKYINKMLSQEFKRITDANWRTGLKYETWWNNETTRILMNDDLLLDVISNLLDENILDKSLYDIFKKLYNYSIKFYKKDDLLPYYSFQTDLFFNIDSKTTIGRFNTGIYQSGLKKLEDFSKVKEPEYIKLNEKLDKFTLVKPLTTDLTDNVCDISSYKIIRDHSYKYAIFPPKEKIDEIKCYVELKDTQVINEQNQLVTKQMAHKVIDGLNTNIDELYSFLDDSNIKNNLILLSCCSSLPQKEEERIIKEILRD